MADPKSRAEKSDTIRETDGQSEKSELMRIQQLLEDRQRDWAWLERTTGIPRSTVSDIRKRGVRRVEYALAIADALDTTLDYLLGGRDGLSGKSESGREVAGNSVATVPEYDIEVAAGAGRFSLDRATPVSFWPFPTAWLAQFGAGAELKLVSVAGDSQEPELSDGDLVMIDASARRLRDGMHVVRLADALLIKRVQIQGGTVRLKSANTAYDDIVVDMAAEGDQFEILGRAVWAGKML